MVSRWDVLQADTRATAATPTEFLDTLQQRMPFPIRAVQVELGSEFAAEFEQACQQRGLRLFVLPPTWDELDEYEYEFRPLAFLSYCCYCLRKCRLIPSGTTILRLAMWTASIA